MTEKWTAKVAEIVAAYVSTHHVAQADLPNLIAAIHLSFADLARGDALDRELRAQPAVPIDQSVTNDYIICLENGKKYKSLKRHLRAHYGLTPEEYRKKWGLPANYPMVAPSYARKRVTLARQYGLGKRISKSETSAV